MFGNIRRNINKSFSRRLITSILLLSVVLLIVFSFITYIMAKISYSADAQKNMQNTGTIASNIIDDYINVKSAQLNNIVFNKDVKEFLLENAGAKNIYDAKSSDNYNKTIEILNNSLLFDDGICSSWIVSDAGGYFLGNSENFIRSTDYNMSRKLWYTKIISNVSAEYCWLSPIMSSYNNDELSVVTLISPILENGNIIGYAGIEISADNLSEYINSYTFSDGSYPLVLSESGSIVYSPNTDGFNGAFNTLQYPISSIAVQAYSDANGLDSFVIDGKEHYRYSSKCNVNSWSVLVLFDGNVMKSALYKSTTQEIIIVACLLALMFIVILNIIRNQTKDLKSISATVEEISCGNYNCIAYSFGESELGTIGKSFSSIVKELHENKAAIEGYKATDSLTKIPNRIKLYESISDLIECRDGDCRRFAMMFVDLDNFKWMNETLGHKFGDDCLIKFAALLSESLNGLARVFRFSGDEFVILADCNENLDPVNMIINKVNTTFDSPIAVCNDNIYIRFSIGVSIFPDDDCTADLLLRDADIALHRAKENGKDRVAFYNNLVASDSISSASIAQKLTTALSNGELSLNYQPIISTQTNDIHGFEVLVRWDNAEFGSIPPAEFIKVAEETGAIIQIGTWIFESACRFLKSLCETYSRDIIMSINVSPVQLKRSDYLDHVRRVIDITRINPKNIQIEITESTLIDFIDSNDSVIQKINDMGIALALDDFGTGYSSLNYLKNFPIKCLKVDKSFVDEIYNSKKDYTITDSIIDLVHNLDIKTVAEGVETVGQYNFLKDMKCDYIQGFLMSKPLNEASAIEFVEKYDLIHKPDAAMLEENEKIIATEREEKKRLDLEAKIAQISKNSINQSDTILSHSAK